MDKYLSLCMVVMFMSGLMVFVLKRKHLLMVLLSLEYMVLVLYFMLFMFFMGMGGSLWMLVMYMVFAVCEGVLGLGIMVSMIRTHGNDFFQSFVVLQC